VIRLNAFSPMPYFETGMFKDKIPCFKPVSKIISSYKIHIISNIHIPVACYTRAVCVCHNRYIEFNKASNI